MANPLETTFQSLQSDERYRKLERTLKLALLRNAERRNIDNGAAGAWPNVSSINGDHLDSSLAAMSVRSSRVGSEVVSSSTNLRNIILHKQQSDGSRNNVATSSENQFPTNKDNDDSAMMPPPRTPGIGGGRTMRFVTQNQRVPLANAQLNTARNSNGFAVSTPATSISSIPKCVGPASVDSRVVFQENDNYAYGDTASSGVNKQERHFYKWRVLLNDKGLLIIKGTLECGKVARSKPVIRRLTPNSVQSVFKHTYHLQGNLVDDRGELPDYVRGKFYNGFPDDWENVYQVWRNFVTDGNRLSFRWPTAVTDSDDDIKSEITEMSYSPDRSKTSESFRKARNRSTRSSSRLDSSAADNEKGQETNSCSCSRNVSRNNNLETPSIEKSHRSIDDSSRNRSSNSRGNNSRPENDILDDHQNTCNRSTHNSTNTERNNENSFAGIISEEKLNSIIDNLTDKNCPTEYINKIVEMFDCMKYIVSYHTSVSNGSNRETPIFRKIEEFRNGTKNNSSIDQTIDEKKRFHDQRTAETIVDEYNDRPSSEKSTKPNDCENFEFENDFYDDDRRISIHRSVSTSQERFKKSQKFQKSTNVIVNPRKMSNEPEMTFARPLGQRNEASRDSKHDSSISDDEFAIKIKRQSKFENKVEKFATGRKTIVESEKENRRVVKNYDSSVSITDDDVRCSSKTKTKIDSVKNNYDSSVSITEDENVDATGRTSITTRKYRNEPPEVRKNYNYNSQTNFHEIDQNSIEKKSNDRYVRKRLDSYDYYTESKTLNVNPTIPEEQFDSEDRIKKLEKLENPQKLKKHIFDDENQWDSRKINVESNYRRAERDTNVDGPQKNLRTSKNQTIFTPASNEQNDFPKSSISNVKSQGNFIRTNIRNSSNDHEDDSAYLSSDVKRGTKKSNVCRLTTSIESTESRINDRPTSIDESSPSKIKIPTTRKKPTVIGNETLKPNVKWSKSNDGKFYDDNVENFAVEQLNLDNKNIVGLTMSPRNPSTSVEPVKPRTRSKESTNVINIQDGKSSTSENKIFVVDDTTKRSNDDSVGEYGSEKNPKLLTAWVPAVIVDEYNNDKCHLIFEGKLLNEAGHVANRKFVTDVIRRRLSPKIIETIGHEFYNLVGDLNDTKHVVPKELTKLCHTGCPGRIGQFCDRWKTLTKVIYKSPLKGCPYNTSVDCLGVPTSSRGRRILPPLNYWAGERVVTIDNKTLYNPGNTLESSIHSSLENTNHEVKKNKSRTDSRARTNETRTNEIKKKDAEKISPPNFGKSTGSSPPKSSRGTQKTRSYKRRITKNLEFSSSESDDDAITKTIIPRKRKMKIDEKNLNTEFQSTRILRNSVKNSVSPQSPEHESSSPKKNSFKKPMDPEVMTRSRKRSKIDDNQQTLQQFVLRNPSEVKTTLYRNVPRHDGDLSEDQLSAI